MILIKQRLLLTDLLGLDIKDDPSSTENQYAGDDVLELAELKRQAFLPLG